MTRRDLLLKDFMSHPIISEKYKISPSKIPSTLEDGLNSSYPIVKSISYMIKEIKRSPKKSEKEVDKLIRKLLNESPL